MKTQHALARALKEIMSTKALDDISVVDISNYCGVSRKTFYYHYHDIYDLLTQVFLDEKVPGSQYAQSYNDLVNVLWDYYKNNEPFINATLASAGRDLFFEFVYNNFYTLGIKLVAKLDEEKKIAVHARKSIARFYASAYANSLVYYLASYKNKNINGLRNCFNFIDDNELEKSVQNASKIKENAQINVNKEV